MKTFNVWVRIVTVFVLSIFIWRFISALSDVLIGENYDQIMHLLIAFATTILVVSVLEIARRIDHLSWKQLGLGSFKNNAFSFLLGFFLWLVPATIGFVICLQLGLVDMKVQSDFNVIMISGLLLFVTVFLIEALPEELLLRGYIYRLLNVRFSHVVTVFAQVILFTLFGYFIGAIYSLEQLLFLPGFAFILGYFRAVTGNIWTGIGFHVAIMTATQLLSPLHAHFEVSGMFILQFFAFILLPSIIGSIVLEFIYPKRDWRKTEPIV